MEQIHALGKKIAEDGFQWQKDGWTIFAICKEAAGDFRAADNDALRPFLEETLIALDKEYGWDLAGRTQEQEEALYRMFVKLYLSTRTVGGDE